MNDLMLTEQITLKGMDNLMQEIKDLREKIEDKTIKLGEVFDLLLFIGCAPKISLSGIQLRGTHELLVTDMTGQIDDSYLFTVNGNECKFVELNPFVEPKPDDIPY